MDKPRHAFHQFWQKLDEASMIMGKPMRIANKLKRWYEEAGFVDVHEEVFKIPINSWPKDPQFKLIGRFWADSLAAGLQGFALALFTRYLGWTKDEVEVYLVDVRQSLQDKNVHSYHKLYGTCLLFSRDVRLTGSSYVVWGRKPTTKEMQAKAGQQLRGEAS